MLRSKCKWHSWHGGGGEKGGSSLRRAILSKMTLISPDTISRRAARKRSSQNQSIALDLIIPFLLFAVQSLAAARRPLPWQPPPAPFGVVSGYGLFQHRDLKEIIFVIICVKGVGSFFFFVCLFLKMGSCLEVGQGNRHLCCSGCSEAAWGGLHRVRLSGVCVGSA